MLTIQDIINATFRKANIVSDKYSVYLSCKKLLAEHSKSQVIKDYYETLKEQLERWNKSHPNNCFKL